MAKHLVPVAIVLILLAGACGNSDNTAETNADHDSPLDDDAGTDDDAASDDDAAPDDDTMPDDDSTPPPPPWSEPGNPTRQLRSLNGTWSFTPEGYPAREVQVPCFWEAFPVWDGYDSCPGYLDGTPDEGLEMTEGNNWDLRTIHRGTYELEIEIPQPSPVTRIWFESINHEATVFMNGVNAGSHIAPYWKAGFDVSAGVSPGQNLLRVELTDGSALLGADGITRWPVGYYSHTDITGLYRSVTMESLPAVYLDDVFIVPSYRRGDLSLEHTLINATGDEFRGWLINRAIDAQGEVALETVAQPVIIPPHGQTQVVVVQPWSDASTWSPSDPYLYGLRTLLMDQDGRPLDLREDRFGFREVWIEDGHFMLNGMRMNLMGDNVDDQASRPRYWATKYLSCTNARTTLERIKKLDLNVIRFHQAPPEDCIYDMTDEMGLLVISESPVFARTDITPPFFRNEEYVTHGQEWLAAGVRQRRNHASIVMWSLENEMWLYWFPLSMPQILSLREPAREADMIQRPDGSTTSPRPVSWDGDSSFLWNSGYRTETINWHYPHGTVFTIQADREWYDDAVAHFQRYLIADVPCGVGETMNDRRPDLPYPTLDMAKAMQGLAMRATRMLGYSDQRPYKLNWTWHYFDPNGNEHPFGPYYHSLYTIEQKERLIKIVRDSFHPIAVFDWDYTSVTPNADGTIGPVALPAGAEVERQLVILNDSFLPDEKQIVNWLVMDETSGAELGRGSFTLQVPHGDRTQKAISFVTPEVDPGEEAHLLTLHLQSTMQGLPQGAFNTEYTFSVGAN